MISFIQQFAEELIQKAMREGQFDDLQGKGRPLNLEDDSMIPAELRMPYKILKNAGCLPPELQAEKDIRTAVDLLEAMEDEQERYRQIQKLNFLITKLNMCRRRPVDLEKDQLYYRKVVERLSVARRGKSRT
ncbi:MAG: DUF1992 domain-containing protein [Desulfovibrionaceae bacterium]|nr:DUF1992 domain-containing protein [Desulfovibrionaceae bacterium]